MYISGHYRIGRCTCRASNQDSHLNDGSSARARISRFWTKFTSNLWFYPLDLLCLQLDQFLPLMKLWNLCMSSCKSIKMRRQHNATYICLVEYVEGYRLRVLPSLSL